MWNASATVIVRAGGAIWLNPFATVLCVLPSLESVVLCTSVAWVCLVCLWLYMEEGSSPVSAITERRYMVLYEVLLSMYLLGFRMGTMLAIFHMCGIMLVLRAVFNMLVRNAIPRGPMCFKCLMFNLSRPCELLFFTLFYGLLDLSCSECDVMSLYFLCCSVNVSVCLVCCVCHSPSKPPQPKHRHTSNTPLFPRDW